MGIWCLGTRGELSCSRIDMAWEEASSRSLNHMENREWPIDRVSKECANLPIIHFFNLTDLLFLPMCTNTRKTSFPAHTQQQPPRIYSAHKHIFITTYEWKRKNLFAKSSTRHRQTPTLPFPKRDTSHYLACLVTVLQWQFFKHIPKENATQHKVT